MNCVQRREPVRDDAVRPIGEVLGRQRDLEEHVRGGKKHDPGSVVLLGLLVAVKQQKGIVRLFRADRR